MFVIALHLTNALFGGKVTTNPAFVQILNQIHPFKLQQTYLRYLFEFGVRYKLAVYFHYCSKDNACGNPIR